MFLGQFHHNLDEKGRLTIPARYRDLLLASGAYVLRGFDNNLIVLPSPNFDALAQRLNRLSLTHPDQRALQRRIFSGATQLEFDKAGRILLPQFLRDAAQLVDEVIVVGNGVYFELWSPEMWRLQEEQFLDEDSSAERFAAYDLTSNLDL
jgi:MraZ protein